MASAEDVKRLLEDGISNGEWFEIIYRGGSNPGAKRRIAPIAILGDKVRARCYTSNSVKPFFLDKIEIIAAGTDSGAIPEWTGTKEDESLPIEDARDIHRLFAPLLSARGWVVEMIETEFGWWVRLYGSFKNGKPRKSPSHVIGYEHTAYDMTVAPDGTMKPGNLRPRTRPWSSSEGTHKKNNVPVMSFLRGAGLSDDEIKETIADAVKRKGR